jgi:iron complex outermembrane receptor protein
MPASELFTAGQQSAILGATTISQMQTALNFDATAGELDYRKLARSNFNMKGQSSLQSAQLCNAAYPINENLEVYAFGALTSYRAKLQDFIED